MLHRPQLQSSQIARRGAYVLGIQTRTFQMMSAQRAVQGPEVSLPDNKIETNTATSGITEDEALGLSILRQGICFINGLRLGEAL